ncbi:MAG: diadenylate cyclase, partial [Lachnospiraceae bacterium]|nr:diadenylate cyclase [Lachnospiraceae bacterium]
LGTRHRAGVGISEETDALTLIVSEETGDMSYSYKGQLWSDVTPEEMRGALLRLQNKLSEEEAKNGKGTARSALSGIGRVARFRRSSLGLSGQDTQEDPFMDPEAVDAESTAGPLAAEPAVGAAEKGGAHD